MPTVTTSTKRTRSGTPSRTRPKRRRRSRLKDHGPPRPQADQGNRLQNSAAFLLGNRTCFQDCPGKPFDRYVSISPVKRESAELTALSKICALQKCLPCD